MWEKTKRMQEKCEILKCGVRKEHPERERERERERDSFGWRARSKWGEMGQETWIRGEREENEEKDGKKRRERGKRRKIF